MERQAGRPFPPFPPSRSLCSGTCLYVLSRRERGTLTDSQCSQVSHLRRRAAALSGRPMYVLERERSGRRERERPLCRRLRRSLPPAVTLIDWGSPSLTHSGRRPPLLLRPSDRSQRAGRRKEEKGCCERVGFYSIARRSAIIQVGCFVRTCS